MARTREFDSDEALTKAMGVFWKKGYFDTSIDDLVDATGVSRYGLYGEFKNKHGLFMEALELYQNTVVGSLFSVVEQPEASLPQVREFLTRILKAASHPMGRFGCLMCNTASEVAPLDPVIEDKVRTFHKRFSAGFRQALKNAVSKSELHSDFDTKAGADFLVGILHASSSLNRSGAAQKVIENMIATALKTLS